MKIEQQPKFQPITLTLETAEEAEALWFLVAAVGMESAAGPYARDFATSLSNWFSNHAQMGGQK